MKEKVDSSIVKMDFMGTPVDCIVKDGVKYLSVTSIGNAIGVQSRTIRKILDNRPDEFQEYSVRYVMDRVDGKPAEQVCLSKEGIISLLLLINTSRYPEEKQSTIKQFKKWAREVLVDAYDRQFGGLIADTWDEQRYISKEVHKCLMGSVHDTYEPQYENGIVPQRRYMDESIMINQVSFGYHERGIRNKASKEELTRLCIAIGSDLAMHERGVIDLYDRKNTITNVISKCNLIIKKSSLPELV